MSKAMTFWAGVARRNGSNLTLAGDAYVVRRVEEDQKKAMVEAPAALVKVKAEPEIERPRGCQCPPPRKSKDGVCVVCGERAFATAKRNGQSRTDKEWAEYCTQIGKIHADAHAPKPVKAEMPAPKANADLEIKPGQCRVCGRHGCNLCKPRATVGPAQSAKVAPSVVRMPHGVTIRKAHK